MEVRMHKENTQIACVYNGVFTSILLTPFFLLFSTSLLFSLPYSLTTTNLYDNINDLQNSEPTC